MLNDKIFSDSHKVLFYSVLKLYGILYYNSNHVKQLPDIKFQIHIHDKINMSNIETKNYICFQQLPRTVTITISSLDVLNLSEVFPSSSQLQKP
ncbi:Integrin Beta-8 [Manis pentadactyla]|nr:Integrin Beta-8 [Manis pentadactyla]